MTDKEQTCIEDFKSLVDRFGVAEDLDWLSVVLFVRNLVALLSIYSEDLKCDVQRRVLDQLTHGGLGKENLAVVLNEVEAFLMQNQGTLELQKALNEEKRATVALVDEMNSLFDILRGHSANNEQRLNRFGEQTVAAVESGQSKATIIRKVRGMLTELVAEFREEARTWEEKARSLERTANLDPLLSELFNRRSFDAKLDDMVYESTSRKTPLSLMMIDVDLFKNVNDQYGHVVGDDLLRCLAKIVFTHSARFEGYAARYGGEELVILCQLSEAKAVYEAEIIRGDVEHYDFVARKDGRISNPVHFTISIGVAELREGMEPEELVEAADKALYFAKNNGRNRVGGYSLDVNPRRKN